MTFKERFRALLDAARVTHQTAATMCGLSIQAVGFLSTGRREHPEPETLRKISRGFDVSSDWLLGLSDEHPSDAALQAHVIARGFALKDGGAPEDALVTPDGCDGADHDAARPSHAPVPS